MDQNVETLVEKAMDGDAAALSDLVRSVQDRVYRLATRMLGDPEAAQDAAQEILIRIVTKLSTFAGESRFETWVYRVAMNYLLTARKVLARDPGLGFDAFGADLLDGLADESAAAPEDHVMLNELRIRCTMAMLLCLDRNHRAAYVLGEILELDHGEAAEVLGIAPASFRKRLSRARAEVHRFTAAQCGLAGAASGCTCRKRLPAAQALGRIGSQPTPALAGAPSWRVAMEEARSVSSRLVAATLQRATGPLPAPKDLAATVLSLVEHPG